jgi:DNA invertase Pin-like site-specific DNA recombinase
MMFVGYARCSTDAQDVTAQRDALTALGVKPNRICVALRSSNCGWWSTSTTG